jgi:IclR family KDG regulon transcriptional repressor
MTIERALDVLCAFTDHGELGISELSRRLKLPKSAVHRVMRTLALKGFVEQDPNRRYRLGFMILELGNACRFRLDLARVTDPVLRELSVRANANTHLAKLDGAEVVDLLRVEYPSPMRVGRGPILRRPVHCTALGKAMLAFGKAESVEELILGGLSRMTRRTITQPDRFRAELERTRHRGYAVDNEEFYAGRRCVAAPIVDDTQKAIAAISISGLITHVTEDRVPQLGVMLMESAATISRHLGYRQSD